MTDLATEPAQVIAARVLACAGVAGLSKGPFGTVATHLPGERLEGVAVYDDVVEIAIVARAGHPLPALADRVRAAVASLVGGRLVNVSIDDLE